jgi:hypothetical protein
MRKNGDIIVENFGSIALWIIFLILMAGAIYFLVKTFS